MTGSLFLVHTTSHRHPQGYENAIRYEIIESNMQLPLTSLLNFLILDFSRLFSRSSLSSSSLSNVSHISRARFSTYKVRLFLTVTSRKIVAHNTCGRKNSFMSPHLGLCGFFFKMKRRTGSLRSRSQSFSKNSALASVFVMRACLSSSL